MFYILSQRRLRWLGHVCRMEDCRIPKYIHYGELASGTRPTGRHALRYKDVYKRDLKSFNITPADLKTTSSDRSSWRTNVKTDVKQAEEKREIQRKERKNRKQQRTQPSTAFKVVTTTDLTCSKCGRRCIGLFSHIRRCTLTNQ
jgi:hypothetical protein